MTGLTDTAVSLRLPYGILERQPQMSDEAYAHLLKVSRDKLASNPPPPPEPMPLKDVAPPAAADETEPADHSGAIEQAVAKRAQKSTPSILGESDPGEPAADWKP